MRTVETIGLKGLKTWILARLSVGIRGSRSLSPELASWGVSSRSSERTRSCDLAPDAFFALRKMGLKILSLARG